MSHEHHHHHHNAGSSKKNIAWAFVLNFGFSIIELIGGLLTNSVAILSDALHDFGDSISLALAWYFEKLSERKPDARYTFGYKRFALLGALINAVVLSVGSGFVLFESIKRLVDPQSVSAQGMFWLALLGIAINGIAVLRMRGTASINERVVSLHLLEDVLGWIAVLIASLFMMWFDLPILDPILSIGISCFILYNVFRSIRETFNVILQGSPSQVELDSLTEQLLAISGVTSVHDLHIWTLDSQYHVLTMHVVVEPSICSLQQCKPIKKEIKRRLKKENIAHVTIEFESTGENCESCSLL